MVIYESYPIIHFNYIIMLSKHINGFNMNKETHQRLISLFFLLSILALIAFCSVSYLQYQRLYCTHKNMIESYQTIRAVNQTLLSLDEGALNISLFLQDKDMSILNSIPDNIISAELNFETVVQLVQDNDEEKAAVAKLTPLLRDKIVFWKEIVTEFSTKNLEGIYQIASDKNRLKLTSDIKQLLMGIKQVEVDQLNDNEQILLATKKDMRKILIFMGLLCAFFFVCSFTLLNKYLKTY